MAFMRTRMLNVPLRGLAQQHNRSYVGLAYHESAQPEHQVSHVTGVQTVDRSLKSFQHTSTNQATSGISTVGQDAASKSTAEPLFEVISSGVGSALLIKLPPDTEITAATGSAVGSSSRVTSKLSLDDNSTVKAVAGKLVGEPMFFQKYYTKQSAGDILLAPPRIGEIAIVNVRGSTKYALRRDAFLAKTDKVTLDLGLNGVKGKDIGLINKLVHTVSGPGTIAISHYGGLYRLSLAAGEEYLVNPRNLVMWDVRTEPTKLHPANPLIPAPRSPLRKYAFVRNVADSPSMQPRLQKMNSIIKTLRNYVLGAPDFVRVKGPGDMFLASRVEPRFESARIMNALAAANDSLTQAFEPSALFPAAPAESYTPDYYSKRKHHPGYATGKSINGIPTYYAEVGAKGKVTFIANKSSE
ncbi:mitochondrial biogenesis AIM24-domain-containing protein [Circinella umbellata]|nr:mitochondrial biogenesis AIM24-domain-containing protein [Circinella umbellata]